MNAGLCMMGLMAVFAVGLALISRTKKGRRWLMGDDY